MADFLTQCMADLKTADVGAFTETFCKRCRQPECVRAKWSGDQFSSRVATQATRLLNPVQADPTSSRYEHLQDFPSLMREAMMQEMADARGDWVVPEIFVLDGNVRQTKPEPPSLLPPGPPLRTPPPVEIPEEDYVNPFDDPEDLEDPEDLPSDEPKVEGNLPRATPAPTPKVGAGEVSKGNTAVPRGGMMIGGGPGAPMTPSVPLVDPWAVPVTSTKVPVVQPGAKIKM